MINQKNISRLPILYLLLLLAGCNSDSENEEILASSTSFLFTANVRDGEEKPPLEGGVSAFLYLLGKEEEGMEETIPIDYKGQGDIDLLAEGKWHINYWSTLTEGNLYFDRNDNSINVFRTDDYLLKPSSFYAGAFTFSQVPGKSVPLKLKPQTSVLTILLTLDNTTSLPETIEGVLSGIVSKRAFGSSEMSISEKGIGSIPLSFTRQSDSPPVYTASQRILGTSNTQKCELILYNDQTSPAKIDLTNTLKPFNDLTTDNMRCIIQVSSDRGVGITFEVIGWGEGDYKLDI